MEAILPSGEKFVAKTIWHDALGGVLGIREGAGDASDYLYIGYPIEAEDGDHILGDKGTFAHRAGGVQFRSDSGIIKGLAWDRGERKVAGEFEFKGKDENGREYEITQGVFDIAYKEPVHAVDPRRTSSASAAILPALRDNTELNARTVAYCGTPHRPTEIAAKQIVGLQGGLRALGVIFHLKYDRNNQPSISRAFAVVDQGVYIPRHFTISQLAWEPGKALSFEFAFSFQFQSKTYSFEDGRVDLSL
ncbi:TPA: hypothetical protein QEM96_001700 [Pseudomonas putida]|nr:hypothetical protein [Pseudomonas putida]